LGKLRDAVEAAPEASAASGIPYDAARPVTKGDRVFLMRLGLEGEVLAGVNEKGLAEILAGSLRTFAQPQDLRFIGRAKPTRSGEAQAYRTGKTKGPLDQNEPAQSANRVDLRGLTQDECLAELDRFMDAALRSGLREFTAVHGKGTGALRKAVQSHLKGCAAVKSFRLGGYGEGDAGVTIVTLS
jgi:DNA mismatch repair protein MutS2